MAIGNLYDEYLNSGDAGISAALNAAKSAASQGGGRKGTLVQQPQPSQPQPTPTPTPVPQPTPIPQPNSQSQFPAANNALNAVQGIQQGQSAGQSLRNTSFATGAPINTIAQNYQPGSIGSNIGNTLGQSFTNPYADLFNGASSPQQPSMTGYKWNAGTGGVSGGNNDLTRQFYSDGTMRSFTGGVENNQPLSPTQYAAPLLNGERSPFSDPSVGALKDAQRSTNVYGQQVVNPSGGGQIISGIGPTVGFLGNARSINKDTGAQLINTPSGGTIRSGPARGGSSQNNNQYADIYRGGWMRGGRY